MDISALYKIYRQFPSVQTDTRKLKQDDIFFALKGPNFNGNSFARQALEAGAAYAVIDEAQFAADHRYILVTDVLETLQELALFHRKQLDIPFLAITGSNGKTTTKELITAVLRQRYKTAATEGNLNNHIGVPLTVLKIEMDTEIAVIEMGANHLHEIESYCRIALPTHGLITNCGKAHIEGFGSEENIRKGKGELYDFLREHNGVVFRSSDLYYLNEMAAGITHQISYGENNADYIGKPTLKNVFLSVEYKGNNTQQITTQLAGIYNFPNVMAAIAVGDYFKVEMQAIKQAIEHYKPDNSRSQWIKKGSNEIILDAYNANPTSMQAAIQNFANVRGHTKILWLGAMKEMGTEEKKEHQALIDLIGQYNWAQVILVGKEFEGLQNGYQWFANSQAAAAHIRDQQPDNASILIKGSRGSKMELLFEALKDNK